MKNKKLRSLLSDLKSGGNTDFENLSNDFAMRVRGGEGNGTCNVGCNGTCNSGCSPGNGTCNVGCNGTCNSGCN